MMTKIVSILKYITIILFVFAITIACEKDFEDVGGNLVDNGVFNTQKQDFELTSFSKNIEASRVDNIVALQEIKGSSIALGIHNTPEFGLLKASIASQVVLPTSVDWGLAPNIDAVYLEIPYSATRNTTNTTDGKPVFELDNVYGNKSVAYQLRVSRLETYLSKFDAIDPSKNASYFSDRIFNTSTELYPWTDFKPNANDTVLYFNRTLLDVSTNNYNPIQVQDTVKATTLNPFIRLPLDESFFYTNFVNATDQTVFENLDTFLQYFKGLLIEANGTDGSLMLLNLGNAKINIYFTNTENKTENEADVNLDLNGDGDMTDTNVTYPVRTKNTVSFPLSRINVGINTNTFERDYSSSDADAVLTNPNEIGGEQKLYVQGAQGSIAVIDLFKNTDLDAIRANNWLINEASIVFNIDENYTNTEVPDQLLLYKIDPDMVNDINEDAHVLDAITEGANFSGVLVKDENDKPIKYKVNITDYISEVLKQDDHIDLAQLGLKVFNDYDVPLVVSDTIIGKYSFNPRGVVLYGNNYNSGDLHYDKRAKLEIHYTEIND